MRDRARIVSGGARPVKAAFALVLLAGCFWHSYGPQMATHADVLVGIARKGADLVGSGRMTAESMPELTYPLERAVAFADRAESWAGSSPPPSLAAFRTLVARYRGFVDALDRVRRSHGADDARAALGDPLAAVEAAAADVHRALVAEGRM
jgi:hypothetical protein